MLQHDVRRFVRQQRLFDADTRLVVALSGGSDSMALLHLIHELHEAGAACLVGVAHFNHQLRDTANRDEQCAAEAARRLGVPFVVDRGDVRARARTEQRSIEDAARASRYEFFERACRECGGERVALGHTRDDQAETMLMRLIRGAGVRGLAGMHPARGIFVRPLLACRRQELRDYLAARRILYVDDESNLDTSVPRNRVRAELLPLLESRFNPSIVDTLSREAELARETWAWMDGEAARLLAAAGGEPARSVSLERSALTLDVPILKAAPRPLVRLALWQAMTRMAGPRPVSFGHVADALGLLDQERGCVDGPGQSLERIGATLVLRTSGARPNRANLFEYQLSIPGEALLREAGCALSVEPARDREGVPEGAAATGRGSSAWVRGDLCELPLSVRNRRPGDRFRPVGVGGQKKVQDYFVDRKVARAERDRVPLVVEGGGRIVWVAGYGIDEAFRVTDASQRVLLLRLRQV